jgi:Ca2+-binding EF-hand superfamily protein
VTRILLAGAALAATALPAAAFAQTKPAAAPQAPQSETRAVFTQNVDATFNEVDTNKDGFVTRAEIDAAQTKQLQAMNAARQQQLAAEFKKLDTNKDNQLSLAEFQAAAGPMPATQPDAPIAKLDTNKDGKISRDEYRAPKLADFDKADANHDGTVTVAELKAATGGK